MNLSYWEQKTWLTDVDFTVIGSGIVGLSCAMALRKKFPKAKILVLEKGMLPQGASTKNAGFACFGSLSEIIDDLNTMPEIEVLNLIQKRVLGLKMLRENLGDNNIGFKQYGGYEIFLKDKIHEYESCLSKLESVNKLLKSNFKTDVFHIKSNVFRYKNIVPEMVFNQFEGQIDTGLMMSALLRTALSKDIKILNNITVEKVDDGIDSALVDTKHFQLKTGKVLIATNGFASKLLNVKVKPARAQVLITKPIENLRIQGTFHIDRGYYYFRNIDNRILFGGGRELDIKAETTTEFGLTERVQHQLEHLLKTVILPDNPFEVEHRWSGIMGVGNSKKTIVKPVGSNIFCGVRLGGMGVAIGSLIGRELAELV